MEIEMNFTRALAGVKIDAEDTDLNAFRQYYRLLTEWNNVMNLTAITDEREVYVKHFLDSLAVNIVFEELNITRRDSLRVIDVGTGAGLPGIPLKIVFPEFHVTLLDSLNKRISFLNEVISSLQLDNTEAVHGRAEDYAHRSEYRESFDLCVSRAVANLAVLAEYCIPYVKPGGYFIAYKSGGVDAEAEGAANAVKLLGAKVEKLKKLTLPGTDIERSFVVIKKLTGTAKKYPRKAGLPSSRPL